MPHAPLEGATILHLLKWFRTKPRSAAPRQKWFRPIPRRRTTPLYLEPLEDRLTPAVLLSTWSGLSYEQLHNLGGGPRSLADVNMAAGINYVAVAGNDGV